MITLKNIDGDNVTNNTYTFRRWYLTFYYKNEHEENKKNIFNLDWHGKRYNCKLKKKKYSKT